MRQNSIRGRLIAIVVLSQAVLAAGLLLVGLFYTQRRLISTLDEDMRAHSMGLAALVRYTEDPSKGLIFDDTLIPSSIDPKHPDLFIVWTTKSGVLARSANWPAGLEIPPTGNDHWEFNWQEKPYRGLRLFQVPVLDREEGMASPPETLNIVYATSMKQLHQQLRGAGFFIAVSSLLLLGVTCMLALWGIGRGLLPLQQLAGQAALVSAQNWELQLPGDIERIAELSPLTDSMKTMLARLRHSFVLQRQFLGNAAHELKTPVAVLKSTLQSLQQRPRSTEEYRAGVEHSLEDLERLERLMQWMLRLARAEQWADGALRRDLQVIDVTATCEEAVERLRPLAESRGAKIMLTSNGQLPFRADPEDLQLVWTNLLENAVRYSPEGGTIQVAVGRKNGGPAHISFQDHGSGISTEDLPHIFERFYRGDPSRTRATGGFGLGLAIAKALIEAYGGTITADSAPGLGTRMTVALPVDSN